MAKILCALTVFFITAGGAAWANVENPFLNGYENQVAFNVGAGVNDGFLIPSPSEFVPFNMLHLQYSQNMTFFGIQARKSLNVIQTIGWGKKYGWNWEKYTIPIAMLSVDISPFYCGDWYTFVGMGAGFQAQQNKRIGSKLIFSFKLGAGYRISECTSVEVFAHHFSNGNTAPENNSYAFYGMGLTYSF